MLILDARKQFCFFQKVFGTSTGSAQANHPMLTTNKWKVGVRRGLEVTRAHGDREDRGSNLGSAKIVFRLLSRI